MLAWAEDTIDVTYGQTEKHQIGLLCVQRMSFELIDSGAVLISEWKAIGRESLEDRGYNVRQLEFVKTEEVLIAGTASGGDPPNEPVQLIDV